MSECKRTFWQKVRGLFIRHQYERTAERMEQLQKEYDKMKPKSNYHEVYY